MATDFLKLREDIDSLVNSLAERLPADQLQMIRSLNKAGEWTEAMENLCAVLVLDQITITAEERDALGALLDTWGPEDDDDYRYINRKAATLAALNVEPRAMATDFLKLRVDIDSLLNRLADRIPPVSLEDIREFNMVGEWTEAMEELCAVLVLDQVPITTEEHDALAALLDTWGPEEDDDYPCINGKASTLAALNVEL